jgi:hypothetical protein
MSDKLTKCPACSGLGFHRCDCWPGDCICGFGDETCEECAGDGYIDPGYDDIDQIFENPSPQPRREAMSSDIAERDIWEVANQLGGYVDPSTEKNLARFLIREAEEAAKLAERIVALQAELTKAREAALEEAAKVAEEMPFLRPISTAHVKSTTPKDVAVAIRNLQQREGS